MFEGLVFIELVLLREGADDGRKRLSRGRHFVAVGCWLFLRSYICGGLLSNKKNVKFLKLQNIRSLKDPEGSTTKKVKDLMCLF